MKDTSKRKRKAEDNTLDKLKKLVKKMKNIAGRKGAAVVPRAAGVNAQGPGAQPAPHAPKPVKISAMISGSDKTVSDDGKFCVGGSADPAENAGQVDVTVTNPLGDVSNLTATVDPNTCRWKLCHPTAQGNLTEGDYTIQATQGNNTVTEVIGVS